MGIRVFKWRVMNFRILIVLVCIFSMQMFNFSHAKEIFLGSSLPLSGPSKELGIDLKKGIEAEFSDWNNNNSKKLGYKIVVDFRDDQYEPTESYRNTLRFLKSPELFSLFSYLGTPTGESAKKLIYQHDLTLYGIFSGAGIFREKGQKHIFNLRASYDQEIEALINHFVATKKFSKFLLVHQSDSFGGSGKAVVLKSLMKRKLTLAGEISYIRNSKLTSDQIKTISKLNPEIVLFVGTYEPFVDMVDLTSKDGFKGYFGSVSFVGTRGVLEVMKKKGNSINSNIVISQVMPNPNNSKIPLVKYYQDKMKKSGNQHFDYGSLEGFFYATTFLHLLELAPKPIENKSFFNFVRRFKGTIHGVPVDFTGDQQQAVNEIFLTKIINGRILDL